MHLSSSRNSRIRSTLRRIAVGSVVVLAAALVAIGCGGDDKAGGPGTSGIVGDSGPLAWLPTDSWLVASARLDPKQLDTAIRTLDRLPAWTLVESMLPAGDGQGLRAALLKELAGSTDQSVSAKLLEQAFGERAGVAIFGTDFDAISDDEGPVAVWIEVDDPAAAKSAMRKLIDEKVAKKEYNGITWYDAAETGAAYAIEDDLLVLTTSPKYMKQLIDTHDGDDSLADDETGRAVIEGGIGKAMAGVAIQTDPLLDAAPELVSKLADEADDPKDAAQAKAIAKDLGPVLSSNAVDGLIADWTSLSLTIDDTGLVVRGAWSNPRELADPEIGSRELLERMPADAPSVSATASDGSMLGRAQDAWAEVQKAYDIDLRDLAKDCDPKDAWACNLAAEAAIAVLEDEDLAKAMEDGGDRSSAVVQDLGAAMQSVLREAQGGAPKPPTDRVLETASTGPVIPKWDPPSALTKAAEDAGLIVSSNEDQTRYTVRVKPGSPLATTLRTNAKDVNVIAQMYGIKLDQLLTPAGATFDVDEVDDIRVVGLPNDAKSKVIPALEGDADTIGDAENYQRVVKAAKPPKHVGLYGYIDLRGYIEELFGPMAATDKDIARIMPTIRNNLTDAPGLLLWSGRDKVDGEEIGTWEYVLPILE